MNAFEVTPRELQSLANQLSGLLAELEQAATNVRSDASAAAQNGQLEQAIDTFLADWSDSVQTFKTKLNQITTRLSGAGEHYASTDSDVASHFGTP
jgi:uncharacterized protein YukE